MTIRRPPLPVLPPLAFALALAAGAGCELVLGPLPAAREHDGGATGGAGGRRAGGGAGGGCCDCDHDGHAAVGLCKGDDCDDTNKLVYPGEPIYYGTTNPRFGHDWDCDGTADPDPTLNKAVDCGLIPLPCSADTGFLGSVPPPCGGTGDWGTCKQQGVMCVRDLVETGKTMLCK